MCHPEAYSEQISKTEDFAKVFNSFAKFIIWILGQVEREHNTYQ